MDFQQEFFDLKFPKYESLSFGAIIGQINLIGTTETETILQMSNGIQLDESKPFCEADWHQELDFGDYSLGRYGWILKDPVLFDTPIPAKGRLGLWEWDLA